MKLLLVKFQYDKFKWKFLSQAKSLQPISLMSFFLKTLEKLLDRYIRGGVMVEKPLHRYQFAYRAGMSTETALVQVVRRLENSFNPLPVQFKSLLHGRKAAFFQWAFKCTSVPVSFSAFRPAGGI
jgi:hypothetical protein